MGIKELAFLFFISCSLFSTCPNLKIVVSASMHEGLGKDASEKLSGGGGARGGSVGGGGARGGYVGGGDRSSGSSGWYRGSTGGGSFIPVYAGAAAGAAASSAASHNNHKHNAANCQSSGMFLVALGVAIMASISLSF